MIDRLQGSQHATITALRSRPCQPWRHDRLIQVYLAQARGSVRNGDLLRQSVDLMLRLRAAQPGRKEPACMDNALLETLSAVVAALEDQSIAYAITGSVASSIHGEPQMTQDVDLVLVASPAQAGLVAAALTPRFYAPADMLTDAAARHSFANVVDNRTGLKADLSFVESRGYPAAALTRRVRARVGSTGPEYWFVSPEDVILMKLLWRKDSGSSKQWENALSVARVRGARMDWRYLMDTARELGIEADLVRLRDEAGI